MNIIKVNNSIIFTIILHLSIWIIITLIPWFIFRPDANHQIILLSFTGLIIFLFYLNTLVLIPYLLTRGKIIHYLLSVFLCLFVSYIVANRINNYLNSECKYPNNREIAQIANWISEYKKSDLTYSNSELQKKVLEFREYSRIPMPKRIILVVVMIFGISTSLKVTQEWYKNERKRKEAENEKLYSELVFLKSQVNPHFLFNTLNSIYSLANKKSDRTADVVIKLSNILRHMLYTSDNKLVSLEGEIQYLNDYIELQRLRLHNDVKINFEVNGKPELVQISPMLLIPFVENAFKHGVDVTKESFINILLNIDHQHLIFRVENSTNGIHTKNEEYSGIGLYNVKRRLNLLYKESHSLKIDQTDQKFTIILTIRLFDELYNS